MMLIGYNVLHLLLRNNLAYFSAHDTMFFIRRKIYSAYNGDDNGNASDSAAADSTAEETRRAIGMLSGFSSRLEQVLLALLKGQVTRNIVLLNGCIYEFETLTFRLKNARAGSLFLTAILMPMEKIVMSQTFFFNIKLLQERLRSELRSESADRTKEIGDLNLALENEREARENATAEAKESARAAEERAAAAAAELRREAEARLAEAAAEAEGRAAEAAAEADRAREEVREKVRRERWDAKKEGIFLTRSSWLV